ncbi:stage II sporulation protein M [Aquisphaera insulae]|uniref:stage II sporulation protein M n=1 Tax=Aquisphaera insulae TaxID=2712864 RepID=UPI0013ECF81C|nr:stage II sporulation protein M [Aquisphaera insulae]
MRVGERLQGREAAWKDLESLVERLGASRPRKASAEEVLRLGQLYRGVCTDLMLAEAHDLPRATVTYLHGLVGRSHNVLYRTRGFSPRDLGRALFDEAPRQLRGDPAVRIAAAVFLVSFLFAALAAAAQPDFARQVAGEQALEQIDHMYAQPLSGPGSESLGRDDAIMAGFYIQHNASIGLQCFAWGILFGLGSLAQLLSNGIGLGTMFGHMATSPHARNFFTFVTAHSSCELTALVFAGAAGLRMGWGLIDTRGQTRLESLRREAAAALPALGVSVILFIAAAFIEGFVSASALPYAAKLAVALIAAALILSYLSLGGRPAVLANASPRGGGGVASETSER